MCGIFFLLAFDRAISEAPDSTMDVLPPRFPCRDGVAEFLFRKYLESFPAWSHEIPVIQQLDQYGNDTLVTQFAECVTGGFRGHGRRAVKYFCFFGFVQITCVFVFRHRHNLIEGRGGVQISDIVTTPSVCFPGKSGRVRLSKSEMQGATFTPSSAWACLRFLSRRLRRLSHGGTQIEALPCAGENVPVPLHLTGIRANYDMIRMCSRSRNSS